jgi:hypothetical protein
MRPDCSARSCSGLSSPARSASADGFFGPLIFTPDANQGPLLGIFITGPLGFVLGGIGGGIYWAARGRHQ